MEKEIEFQANNVLLRGRFHFSSDHNVNTPLVVLVTGYGDSGTKHEFWGKFMNKLAANGLSSFVFDFSGQGFSEGNVETLTPRTAVVELEWAVRTAVQNHGAKEPRVSLLAVSFGGLVAVQYVAKHSSIHALALVSPVSDYCEVRETQIGQEGIARWKQQGYFDFDFGVRSYYQFYEDSEWIDTYALAGQIQIPCLIVHGDADINVPVEQSRRLAACLGGRTDLVILPGVNHSYAEGDSMDVMMNTTAKWLQKATLENGMD
jgi:alpha-beta hydrolase superfamily lysophospholipase